MGANVSIQENVSISDIVNNNLTQISNDINSGIITTSSSNQTFNINARGIYVAGDFNASQKTDIAMSAILNNNYNLFTINKHMKIKRVGTYITGFKYYKYMPHKPYKHDKPVKPDNTGKEGTADLGREITDEDTINKIKKFKIPPSYDNVVILNNKKYLVLYYIPHLTMNLR